MPQRKNEGETVTIKVDEPVATRTTVDDNGATKTETVSGAEARKAIDVALEGPTEPVSMRELAQHAPEKDNVQKAYKKAYLADSPAESRAAKAEIVEASPDASETPSGAALLRVKDVSSPSEAGEKYARLKSLFRWGAVRADEISE